MANDKINAEVAKLEQSAILVFFVLDATTVGGDFFRFYSGTDGLNAPLTWQGNEYTPMPVVAQGFEFKGQGSPPRPTLVFGNVGGAISALCINFDDLIGAKIIRKRTYARFLDGMPDEDTTQSFPDDIYAIERKVQETKSAVEFELATRLDVDDVSLPRRQFIPNLCPWRYRGAECGFTSSTVVATKEDVVPGVSLTNKGEWDAVTTYHVGDFVYLATTDGHVFYWVYFDGGTGISGVNARPTNTTFWKRDECSKRVRGCGLRFDSDPSGLPFGGFPAADRQS